MKKVANFCAQCVLDKSLSSFSTTLPRSCFRFHAFGLTDFRGTYKRTWDFKNQPKNELKFSSKQQSSFTKKILFLKKGWASFVKPATFG
jgi:hypothetical protein